MPARAAAAAPRSLPKGTRLTFAGIVLGTSLAALDTTVVATALPTISSELDALDHIPWIASVYLLTSTVTLPVYGKLGDLLGRQRVLRASIGIFLVGSVLSGASRSLAELIAFRAVQGVGAGGLIVLSYALIADLVSPRERGRYQGYVGAVHGAAVIAGPLAGGLLTDHLSWRWVFYVNVPVGLISLLAMSRSIRVPTRRSRIDWTGALVLSGAATTVALVLGRDDPRGVTVAMVVTAAAVVAACGWVLFHVERRAPEPIVPLSLFSDRTFRIAAGVSFLIGAVQFGALSFLPLLIQVMYGASATGSGVLLVPLLLALIACSALAGQIASRTGRYKVLPVVGCGLLTVSLGMVATIHPGTPRSMVGAAMVVLGAGIGLTIQTFTLATQNSVRPEDMGVATSLVHFARAIGGLVGVALVGSIVTQAVGAAGAGIDASALSPEEIGRLDPGALARLTEHVTHGFATGALAYAGLMALGALAALRLEEIPLRTTVTATVTASPGP
jgi:EmrB/QacA subfamily drug resistance transporter